MENGTQVGDTAQVVASQNTGNVSGVKTPPKVNHMLPPTPGLPSCSGTPLLYSSQAQQQRQNPASGTAGGRLLSSGMLNMLSPPLGAWPNTFDSSPLFSYPSPALSTHSGAPSPALHQMGLQFPSSTRLYQSGLSTELGNGYNMNATAQMGTFSPPYNAHGALHAVALEASGAGVSDMNGRMTVSGAVSQQQQQQQGQASALQSRPTLLERVVAASPNASPSMLDYSMGMEAGAMFSSPSVIDSFNVFQTGSAAIGSTSLMTPQENDHNLILDRSQKRRDFQAARLVAEREATVKNESELVRQEKRSRTQQYQQHMAQQAGAKARNESPSHHSPYPSYSLTRPFPQVAGHQQALNSGASASGFPSAFPTDIDPFANEITLKREPSVIKGSKANRSGDTAGAEGESKIGMIECPKCPSSFRYKSRMFYHSYTAHDERGLYPCTICESAFRRRSELRKHLNCVHEKIRPFACELCPASFYFRKDLRKHVSTVHEKSRPFACPHCNNTFGKKEHLKRHFQLIHTEGASKADDSIPVVADAHKLQAKNNVE